MRMTVTRMYDAVNAIVSISNSPRMIPAIAKYKLARMHDAFEPVYNAYEQRRIALVREHGSEQFADPENKVSLGWGLKPNTEAFDAYAKIWTEVCKEEVEIDVKPITLQLLGNDPKGVELSEFKQLSDLVINTDEVD